MKPYRTRGLVGADLLAHILARTTANGSCLEWVGPRNAQGYGRIKVGGKNLATHRLVMRLARSGEDELPVVRHLCNNPPCCNPKHLQWGTQKDNVGDSIREGTFRPAPTRRGERSHYAKLTEAAVRAIRTSDLPLRALARDHGVHPEQVRRIRNRQSWSHLE